MAQIIDCLYSSSMLAASGEEFCLLSCILFVGQRTRIVEIRQRRELIGGACAGVGNAPDVVVLSGLRFSSFRGGPFLHLAAVCDQVHEHAEERQDDYGSDLE